MARRASKVDTPAGKKAGAAEQRPTSTSAASEAQARILALEAERQKLSAELTEARTRIEGLEKRQAEIADRIAWALDSLHDLISVKN
jgi:chromosome segregation ATPase